MLPEACYLPDLVSSSLIRATWGPKYEAVYIVEKYANIIKFDYQKRQVFLCNFYIIIISDLPQLKDTETSNANTGSSKHASPKNMKDRDCKGGDLCIW